MSEVIGGVFAGPSKDLTAGHPPSPPAALAARAVPGPPGTGFCKARCDPGATSLRSVGKHSSTRS